MIERNRRFRSAAILLAAVALIPVSSLAQKSDARKKLDAYLSKIGAEQSDRRAQQVAAIQTRDQAERRRQEVRKKIVDMIGGLPEFHGPVKFKQFGEVPGEGFKVEKIAYESLPGYFVTGDVYVPTSGPGPFPAVIVTPGHGPGGKTGEANWAVNFAHAGIITLAIDAFGQGERLQHYDPELEASRICCSGEHEHANLAAELIGQHIARYFVNDGMRGVDYLIARKDVDRAHIGAFGCSGGGTATAYLGALDPRISVTGTACYITSLKEVMAATGAQDAEQTIPGFLEQGLDLADWVELSAPRPYVIISTTEDMFPFAGAKQAYEEAKRIYGLYGAGDRLQWITGPGGHGNLGPISQQILAFMVKNLKGDSATVPAFTPYRMANPDDLIVTPTGQISTSLNSETVESLTRKEAKGRIVTVKPVESKAALGAFQERLRATVREVAAMAAQPGKPPDVTVGKKDQREGYSAESLTIHSEPGIDLPALLLISGTSGAKPAVLVLDDTPLERVAASPDMQRLAKNGHVVLLVQPRGTSSDAPALSANQAAQQTILGTSTGMALQAMVVGKNLVGMRSDDAIRAVNWLVSLPDVQPSSITVYGKAAEGMVALHAAALDTRIAHVVVDGALVSYRMALEAPLHRNLSDIIVPGVLLKYDTSDLIDAISPRSVQIINPVDSIGVAARDQEVNKELAAVFESDRKLDQAQRVRVIHRGLRDPLPIE